MNVINRKEEIRTLMKLTPEEIIQRVGKHLIVCDNLIALLQHFAENIAMEIRENNARNCPTKLILPIGPIRQYPILADIINKEHISLANCWIFFMDEYCDENGKALSEDHPLSFKRIANEMFFDRLVKTCEINFNQVFFPDEINIGKLGFTIKDVGGIDTCYGGIGIHGHVAFNEPEPKVSYSEPRKVNLNNFTITINAIRAQVGGDIVNFPKEAFTLGMKQILNAKRIRLYCRNGSPYDWANVVLRIALLGRPGDDYPVTYVRNHSDYVIITDIDTLATPKILL